MNYEKAYKEALERARADYNNHLEEGYKNYREHLETIFPELRESEDERARKAALEGIEYLERKLGWDAIGDTDILDVKEYLEKQKEQKQTDLPAGFYFIDLDGNKYYSKEFRYGDMKVKVAEQKPAECIEDSVKFEEGFKAGRESGLRDGQKYVLNNLDSYGLCKPAEWSEEDEKMREKLINLLGSSLVPLTYKEWSDYCFWLKSLRPQPKQEWSEEDEKIMQTMIKEGDLKPSEIAWLKSLRPQPQKLEEWTEEDERMWKSALWHIKNSCGNGGKNSGEFEVYQWFENRVKSLRLVKQEWNEEDEKNLKQCIEIVRGWEIDYDYANPHYSNWLKSVRLQTREEVYQAAKHDLAIKFMNYLDENRPEEKMSLSNGECKDIDKAFKENDWAKIIRYVEKYKPHWKPSKEQINCLCAAVDVAIRKHNESVSGYEPARVLKSLYEQLKNL